MNSYRKISYTLRHMDITLDTALGPSKCNCFTLSYELDSSTDSLVGLSEMSGNQLLQFYVSLQPVCFTFETPYL